MTIPAFNPVALKELRQLTRTRLVSLVLVGYPILLFIIFAFAQNAAGHSVSPIEAAYGSGQGTGPFTAIGVFTGIITCIIIPLVTSTKTTYEYIKGRMGLEFTTTLTPMQIVNGKIMAAGIISGAIIAVSMPFFAITYLMRGVELVHVFSTPAMLFLFSLAETALCLPIATSIGSAPAVRLLLMVMVNASTCGLLSSILSIDWDVRGGSSTLETLAPYISIPLILSTVILLARSGAAAQISPPFVDSDRPLRRTTAILILVTAPLLFLSTGLGWCICWGVVSVIMLARSASTLRPMPRSVIAKAPKSFFKRLFAYPFATGPASGQFFALLVFAITATVGVCLGKDFDAWLQYVLATVETFGLIIFASNIGRKIGSPRAMKAMLVLAVVWVAFANFSNALAEMHAIGTGLAQILPCNYYGIHIQVEIHSIVTVIMVLFSAMPFAVMLLREFRNYRRP